MRLELDYLQRALAAAMKEQPLPPPPEELDHAELYRQATLHGVTPILAEGMQALDALPTGVAQRYLDDLRKNKVRVAKQKVALEEIEEGFAAAGIRYLPLKGCVLWDYYPKASMRLMSDLDILIDPQNAAAARRIMERLGYTAEEYLQGNHDVYLKPPILNVEIHRELTDPTEVDYQYLLGAWDRAAPDAQGSCAYHMTREDYYIFHVSHLAKHLLHEQVTARQIADLWVLLDRFGREYDWSYIQAELGKAGLLPFGDYIRRLTLCWFGQEIPDAFIQELTAHILEQREQFQSFGTVEIALQYGDGKGLRFRYALQRIFMPLSAMQTRYPILKKAPILLPVFWPVRWFSLLFFHRDRVKKRLDSDKHLDLEKAREFRAYMEKLGLK